MALARPGALRAVAVVAAIGCLLIAAAAVLAQSVSPAPSYSGRVELGTICHFHSGPRSGTSADLTTAGLRPCRWARPAAMVPAVPGLWLRDARPPLPATTNIALQRTATSRTIIHRQYCRATAPRRTRPGSRRTRLRSSRRLARQSTRLRRLKRRWVTIEGALRLVRPLRRPVLHRRQRHRHRQERFNPIPLPRGGQRHRSCQPPHPSVARRTRPPLRRWQARPDASSHQSCSAAERCARLS